MEPTGVTGRIARATADHAWLTIAIWLGLLALSLTAASRVGEVLTDSRDLTVATESGTAHDLINAARTDSGPQPRREFVIVESLTATTVDADAFQVLLDDLERDLRATDHVVSVAGPDDGGAVSADGRHALLHVSISPHAPFTAAVVPFIETVAAADETDGFRVVPVGSASVTAAFNELAEETLVEGERIGLPVALTVLVLVFGALVAALLPIGLALASIAAALGMTFVVGQVTELDLFVVNMIAMIGLAVGIDYALFVVQRFREERGRGLTVADAVVVAADTATRAVLFSGVTVVIALLGLLLVPETTMRSLGVGAILAVLASVAAAATLLPAVLRLLGDRVDRLRVPFTRADQRDGHRFWTRITSMVTARPMVSAVLAGGVLIVLSVPYLSITLGSNFLGSLPPDADVRHGFELLASDFGGGITRTPIVIEGDVDSGATDAAVARFVEQVERDPAFGDTTVEQLSPTLLVVGATSLTDPSSRAGTAAVERLRRDLVPWAFDGVPVTTHVGGDAAFVVDMIDVIEARTPIVFTLVLALSFVLLTIAFRSVVVPLKAIVMNLLSVGASYGLLVAVFQWGWGAGLLGFQQTDVIESWVPLFLFAVLFGLSMDYHVFLLSRIKEHYDRTRDNTASVRFGLASTGAIITGAALIMVGVFGGFAAGDLVMFQQMGFGLAVSVVLDATLVRTVLVPSTMELLGDRNWYLPAWLSWLPAFEVETTSKQLEDLRRSETDRGRTTDDGARAHGVRTKDHTAVV